LGLDNLKLNGLDKITDEATKRFCTKNKRLENLELCKCDKLTPQGIEDIIIGLNCLTFINVNLIPKVTAEALQDTLDTKPKLKFLTFAQKCTDPKKAFLKVPQIPKKKKKKGKKKKGKK
jgi:hypothetical protein